LEMNYSLKVLGS